MKSAKYIIFAAVIILGMFSMFSILHAPLHFLIAVGSELIMYTLLLRSVIWVLWWAAKKMRH